MAKPSPQYESESVPEASTLSQTHYAITITGGLADVALTRTFRNDEERSIEGVLTFPLPIHAVLYDLEARIDDRVIGAVVEPASQARLKYEESIADGRTSVLHAELLRGIHQISVGQLHAGSELAITLRFAMALSSIGGTVGLRIPTTVGDIYGDSQMLDCDDLVFGGRTQAATLLVATENGRALLNGHALSSVPHEIILDVPIDIEIEGWKPKQVTGVAGDGRVVTLEMTPDKSGDGPLDLAILVDCSGSMNELWSHSAPASKHEVVCNSLTDVGCDIDDQDLVEIWDFNDSVERKGSTQGRSFEKLVGALRSGDGGTEIGAAIQAVLAERKIHDILLITDGKSHSLSIQYLARSGSRFSVVLIGEDSLEANVGHLAALTGGHLLVPQEPDQVGPAIRDIVSMVRHRPASQEGKVGLHAVRGGMGITASWKTSTKETMEQDNRATAAYAASLMLPGLSDEDAVRLAATEGLVTHLTSFIMFDYEGPSKPGTPHLRKLLLSTPRTVGDAGDFVCRSVRTVHSYASLTHRELASRIDWHEALSNLGNPRIDFDSSIIEHPVDPLIIQAAHKVGMKPRLLYSAILAGLLRDEDVAAAEYYEAISAKLSHEDMETVADCSRRLLEEEEQKRLARLDAARFKPKIIDKADWAVLLGRRINWEAVFEQLRDRNDPVFPADVETELLRIAAHPLVSDIANLIGKPPLTTLLGLIGHRMKQEIEHAGPASREVWRKLSMEHWMFVTGEGVSGLAAIDAGVLT